MKSLSLTFDNKPIHMNHDGWFNATDMANAFGKRPIDWLKQKDTIEYIALLCEEYKVTEDHFVKTRKGGSMATRGTWFSHELAIRFAQWLDKRFAIWCDRRIKEMLSGSWQQERNDSKASNRVMNRVIQLTCQRDGREAKHYDYSNDALMCNEVLTGTRQKIDRDSLNESDLKRLTDIELENSSLRTDGMSYQDRKATLIEKYRQTALLEVAL